jgi:outer membrane protein OmpA-like peptidoglycan-associated protein
MRLSTLVPLSLLASAACAQTGPSPALIDARRAYDAARGSAATSYAPSRLLEAKQALDRAERAHRDSPASDEEQSYSYVATRRAELAVIYGEYEKDLRERAASEQAYRERQEALRKRAEGNAANAQRALDDTRQNLLATRNDLTQEQQARLKAESNAAAALASLDQLARVKEEARGTVITLDGSVLFVSGKANLLPIAQKKLDDVAKALSEVDERQKIIVEGHTDSNGNDESNLQLSQQRAEAVRAHLLSRGLKAERIQAVGKGEAQPVASNDTAEGRANNRRVEIIVQKQQ